MVGSRPRSDRSTNIEAIKAIALRQLAIGGHEAVSLNGIARELGLTGPALYRYVSSRDALINEILLESFDEFGSALEAASARPRRNDRALLAAAHAYRTWALERPMRYQLMMGTQLRDFALHDEVAERATAAFGVLLDLVERFLPNASSERRMATASRGWTRLHGFVSLELAGHLAYLNVEPDHLFTSELDQFLAELQAGAP